jgi:5S rRNA maturation endonuclease (ribonuclease M5)
MYDPKQKHIGIPWYWQKVLVGFTTRTIVEGKLPKATTAPGFKKGQYFYVPSKWLGPVEHIVLVEGEFDAMKIYQSHYMVAAVGHGSFTTAQHERLKTLPVKSLVLFFDHDRHGFEMTQSVGAVAEQYAKSVLCANYNYVASKAETKIDPGAMGPVRIMQAIRTAKRYTSWPAFSA